MSEDKSHDYKKRLSVELTSSLFKDDGNLYNVSTTTATLLLLVVVALINVLWINIIFQTFFHAKVRSMLWLRYHHIITNIAEVTLLLKLLVWVHATLPLPWDWGMKKLRFQISSFIHSKEET